MNVHILIIQHSHRTTIETHVCATKEIARRILAEYCEKWWYDDADMPADPNELIDLYFKEMNESYLISEKTVIEE